MANDNRYTPEQIVCELSEGEAKLGAGASVSEAAKELGICEATFHRSRKRYGDLQASSMKRLRELEKENARLKKVVAEQVQDIDIPK